MKHQSARFRSATSSFLSALCGSLFVFSLLPSSAARAQDAVSFTTFGGNEWWVEVYVDGSVNIEEVDVSVEGAAWRALTLQEWGSWATSFFVEPGSRLIFRALGEGGQIATSSSYLWPSGDQAGTLEEPPSDDDPAFAASFFAARGNEWWVEIEVSSGATIVAVDARANEGVWVPLARTGWGSWAASFFVPAGSVVEMRAIASGGAIARSAGYSWPDGAVVFPPPDEPSDPPTNPEPPLEEPQEPEPDEPEPPAEPGIANATFDDERVGYLGRVDDRVDGQPACSWTGCGFVIVTDASEVWMEVEANVRNGATDYFRVQIDDEAADLLELNDGQHQVRLAANLGSGSHTITLYKRTEPQVATVRFLGLELEDGGLLQAPLPSSPRLLVIGDSITAAYGNAGDGPFCGFSPRTEDGWNSYANLTAQRFGGEAIITAFSGKGVYRNRSLSDPWTMPLLFDRLDVFDAASHEGFGTIDAVVINLGTNDFASTNPPAGPFIDAYTSFVAELRARFPSAPIVLAMGPMMTDEWPPGLEQRSTLRAYLQEVVDARAASGDEDVYLVEHAPQSTEGLLGCDYHPHGVTHERMADELSEALSLITGW